MTHWAAVVEETTTPSPKRIQTAQLHRKGAQGAPPIVGTKNLAPNAALQHIRDAAIAEKTQLWFGGKNDLEHVVLAGRMAALEAVDQYFVDPNEKVVEAWKKLTDECAAAP
jgi:hypothetical protein